MQSQPAGGLGPFEQHGVARQAAPTPWFNPEREPPQKSVVEATRRSSRSAPRTTRSSARRPQRGRQDAGSPARSKSTAASHGAQAQGDPRALASRKGGLSARRRAPKTQMVTDGLASYTTFLDGRHGRDHARPMAGHTSRCPGSNRLFCQTSSAGVRESITGLRKTKPSQPYSTSSVPLHRRGGKHAMRLRLPCSASAPAQSGPYRY